MGIRLGHREDVGTGDLPEWSDSELGPEVVRGLASGGSGQGRVAIVKQYRAAGGRSCRIGFCHRVNVALKADGDHLGIVILPSTLGIQ